MEFVKLWLPVTNFKMHFNKEFYKNYRFYLIFVFIFCGIRTFMNSFYLTSFFWILGSLMLLYRVMLVKDDYDDKK